MITQEVIKKAQQGDSDAFTRIYNETIKTAYYVAKRILLDEQAVEDVLQESYIAVYEHLGDYKAGNFQGWVDTIVANRSKNYLRKKNPILFSQMETENNIDIEFEEEKIEFRPDVKVDYDETKRLVMNIVDGLSDEQRLAVILFYFEQRSVKEIAVICECSENTVKSRLNYARKKIKEDVLELEKKGTKLYSVSVLPFLYWLFKEDFKACEVPTTTSSAVANATGKAIKQATGKASSLSNAGTKATETVAKAVVEETVKTGMALGTKIAIGVAVATISVGGIALGSTLLKDTTPPTEQSSEKDTQQDIETEQDSEREEATELTREEIDVIVNDFIADYFIRSTLYAFDYAYSPVENDIYAQTYCYFWCNDIPIVVTQIAYHEQNYQVENINDITFYYVDKETGKVVEMEQLPNCFENYLVTYEIYTSETGMLIGKMIPSGDITYFMEDYSTNSFVEMPVSYDEAQNLIQNEVYSFVEWKTMSEVVTTQEADDVRVTEFLNTYYPDNVYEVCELKGEAPVMKYFKSSEPIQYVSFFVGDKLWVAVSIPYGATEDDVNTWRNIKFFYYNEEKDLMIGTHYDTDLTCDAEGYPLIAPYDVYLNESGNGAGFVLYNGTMYVEFEDKGIALNSKARMVEYYGGTPLKWKNK